MSVTIPLSDYKTQYRRSKENLVREYHDLIASIAPIVPNEEILSNLEKRLQYSLANHNYAPYINGLRKLYSTLWNHITDDPMTRKIIEQIKLVHGIRKIIRAAQNDATVMAFTFEAREAAGRTIAPWQPVLDEATGELYWWNQDTNQTQYEDPRETPSPFHPVPISFSQPWRKVFDESTGNYYWFNASTGQTQWNKPVGMKEDDALEFEDLIDSGVEV
jgi:hypothetical protein